LGSATDLYHQTYHAGEARILCRWDIRFSVVSSAGWLLPRDSHTLKGQVFLTMRPVRKELFRTILKSCYNNYSE
jgi:hypothetical protein